jgi:phage/plasmid-associated DNA primase
LYRYDGGEESRPLVDFDEIQLDGREVRLCFDSDLHKPQVLAQLKGLAEFLKDKGARVLIEVLPNDLNGDRLGIDDLIYRHGAECFHRIAAIARTPFKTKRQDGVDVLVWAFNPEPLDTRERNAYLSGLVGRHWRRSTDAKDHWQRWTGTHWEALAGDDLLCAEVERFMELQQWKNRELATIRSLLAAFRRSVEPASDAAAAGLLPFLNGCLRLADAALLPHDHENGNSWVLPYGYDPEAGCPDTEKFLLDRLGDEDSVAVFRAFARCLLVGDRLKSFLEITGPSNTGKSVLANLLVALVGNSNTAAGTLQRLEDRAQRFETLKLRGRRLAIFSEAQDFAGQLQTLKALTGGDPIAAEVKGGRHLDFTFTGGVVLVGNGPIRASDPSGAVINRRRSLLVRKVVAAAAERPMLDPDGHCGWRGELAAELPGLVNWCLAMTAGDAKAALARDVNSEARANAEAEVLLATESLAEWAENALAWNEGGHIRVGDADEDADQFAYANYLRWLMRQGRNSRPLALRSFKAKLVDILRDTLGLALPPGSTSKGDYRVRGVGSVIPNLRMRFSTEEGDGVIMHGFKARIAGTDKQASGTDAERVGNGKTPIGNGWNGWNGSNEVAHKEENAAQDFPYRAMGSDLSVPAVPSVPYKGSCRSLSVPENAFTVPVTVPAPSIDLIPPPAEQIEKVRQRQAKPKPPAHRAPATAAEWVEAALAELRLAPHITHLPEVVAWINRQPTAPLIAQAQLAGALDRLQADDRDGEQQGLDLEVAA